MLMLPNFFKEATFSRPLNLHTCIFLVELYRFGQCLDMRFLATSTFFSLAISRAFRDAPHSRFWCRDPKLCLLNFSKMLDLAFFQIYTRIFHFWKSIALNSVWVEYSLPYQLSFLS